jgi:hypothetical protein
MTIATLATTLRNDLLSTRALGDHEGVGAYTWLCTVWAVLTSGQTRREAAEAEDRARQVLEFIEERGTAEERRALRSARWMAQEREAAELAALEAAAEERDAEEVRVALHPRYVQRGGDVVDTNAGRFYCTLTAWPYSPAARDGAVLGRAAA